MKMSHHESEICLALLQNHGNYLGMRRGRLTRQIVLMLLSMLIALGIGQATVASEIMSLEMAKRPILMADMPEVQCQTGLSKPCDKAARCQLTCAAPLLWMPTLVVLDVGPQIAVIRSLGNLPSPMGVARRPDLPPPRTTDI